MEKEVSPDNSPLVVYIFLFQFLNLYYIMKYFIFSDLIGLHDDFLSAFNVQSFSYPLHEYWQGSRYYAPDSRAGNCKKSKMKRNLFDQREPRQPKSITIKYYFSSSQTLHALCIQVCDSGASSCRIFTSSFSLGSKFSRCYIKYSGQIRYQLNCSFVSLSR